MERRLELIGEMTPAIWVHLIAAVIALVLGGFVLWRRKGDWRHKLAGRIWVATMLVVAVSSFWITEIREEGFSPIHALSVYTLLSLTVGIWALRKGPVTATSITAHKRAMQGLYGFGLLIAGGFTLLPFRFLGRMTFGETMPWINYAIVAAMVSIGVVVVVRSYGSIARNRIERV
ncbi:MAG: DUF2306 domain-containing protein [Pseudomonadota bacterium]